MMLERLLILAVRFIPRRLNLRHLTPGRRGMKRTAENRSAEQEIGVIPMDSIFSPILRVRYRTEAMRVGQQHQRYRSQHGRC